MNINHNLTIKILKYSLWVTLYLALITPLLISSAFVFPFITLKTIFFRTVIEVAALLYLLLALSHSAYRPKFNQLIYFVLGFGALILITAMTGVDPYRSIFGTIERGEGFLFISHLLAYFFILSQTFKTKKEWFAYLTASVIVSIFIGLYAIAQNLNLSFAVSTATGDRWSSTLGNPSYLGAYTLGHFWLSLYLFYSFRHYACRTFFALTALYNTFLLFNSQTRGAMVAYVIFVFLFIVASLIIFHRSRKLKIGLIFLIILFLTVSLLIYSYRDNSRLRQFEPLHRLINISPHNITVESRLYAVDSSWRAWQDRFLVGYGWENYNIAFNKYFHAEIFRDNGSQIWFDRAHNTIFDVAVAAGFFGLIIYLGLYVAAFIILIKSVRRASDGSLDKIAIMALLGAHFLQNIFVFDSLPTYLMLFMVLAYVSQLSKPAENFSRQENIKPLNIPVLALGVVVLIFCFYNLNLMPAKANMLGIKAMRDFYLGDIDGGIEKFNAAIKMNTYQTPELRQKLAENILFKNTPDLVKDKEKIKANYELAFNVINDNLKEHPLDAQNHLYLMALYNAAAPAIGHPGYYSAVLTIGQKALKLSPTRPQIYFEMGRAAISQGQEQIKTGVKYFEQALSLNPKNMDSHWALLTAYIVVGDNENTQKQYETMIKRGLAEDTAALERLAAINSSIKNYLALEKIYQKLVALDKSNFDYWSRLSATYAALGYKTKALSTANQMLKLFPAQAKDIQAFINSLN